MEVYNGLLFFFVVGTIIGGSFLAWTYTKPGKNGLRNCSVMSYLALFFLVCSIFSLSFIAWTYTKPGKKWLKEL